MTTAVKSQRRGGRVVVVVACELRETERDELLQQFPSLVAIKHLVFAGHLGAHAIDVVQAAGYMFVF